jgi:hypothetical protein
MCASRAVFPEPFTANVEVDPLLANALAFQAGVCVLLLVAAAASKFVLGRGVAATLVILYVCFLALCLLIGLGVLG